VEYRVDPDVGQSLVPSQRTRWVHEDFDQIVVANSAGFHDREHPIEKPADVYRILVLGDSFIEALSVPIESGFTYQLEQSLQRHVRTQRVEVINMGIGGMGPAQHLRVLEARGIAYHPDLVIMSVFPNNDFWDSYEPLSGAPSKVFYRLRVDGSLEYIPADGSWTTAKARPALRKSAVLRILRDGINHTSLETWFVRVGLLAAAGLTSEQSMQLSEWGVYLADRPEPWPDAYRTTLQCIKSASNLSLREGAKFAVMLIGSVATVEDRWEEAFASYAEAKSINWDFDYPFAAITALGQQAGFEVINLVPPFREDYLKTRISRSWPHDGHWNPSGHELAAGTIAWHLRTHRTQYRLPN
jgi:hypothetical protein